MVEFKLNETAEERQERLIIQKHMEELKEKGMGRINRMLKSFEEVKAEIPAKDRNFNQDLKKKKDEILLCASMLGTVGIIDYHEIVKIDDAVFLYYSDDAEEE